MKHAGHLISAFLFVTLGAQAHAQAPHEVTMMVDHPWARATPGGAKTGAVYLTLMNHGSSADRLLGATTAAADKVEFHNATEENGVARMRQMRSVDVAPGASVAFSPGGMHIMLVGLKQPLKEGQAIALTLNFEKAGKEDVTVPVGKIGAMQYGDADAAAHGAHDHAH
jgi:copper(I)-binding protein